jgi:copper chaperone CopZ
VCVRILFLSDRDQFLIYFLFDFRRPLSEDHGPWKSTGNSRHPITREVPIMKRLVCAAALVFALAAFAQAETIKLSLKGVKCEQCASEIITAIEKTGAKVKGEPTKLNPIATVDLDTKKTDVGAIAKLVAAAETPHKDTEAPAASVVLSAPGLTAANAKELAKALDSVKGVDAKKSDSDLKKKEITVALKDDGAAKLADIQKALATYLKK